MLSAGYMRCPPTDQLLFRIWYCFLRPLPLSTSKNDTRLEQVSFCCWYGLQDGREGGGRGARQQTALSPLPGGHACGGVGSLAEVHGPLLAVAATGARAVAAGAGGELVGRPVRGWGGGWGGGKSRMGA